MPEEGWRSLTELAKAIRTTINWDALPKVSSTILFQRIKNFLIAEKEQGARFLSTVEDLYQTFLKIENIDVQRNDLRAEFETCVG